VDSAAIDPATSKWVAALTDTVHAKLLVQLGMDAPVRLWLDGEGFPLRAELPNGLVLERTAFEIANLNFRNGDRPAGPRVRLRRHLASEGDPVLPEDSAATLVFPARDSAIAALRDAVLPGSATRADTLDALAHWIGRRIRVADGTDDAVATLQARSGSAVGRARLFVAAARGARIPARLALGVRQDGLQWTAALLPEAYIDGWRQVDLGRGRIGADSSVRMLRLRSSGFPFEQDALLASFMRHPE
jgi:transglutaminase-like putative cysteine protease